MSAKKPSVAARIQTQMANLLECHPDAVAMALVRTDASHALLAALQHFATEYPELVTGPLELLQDDPRPAIARAATLTLDHMAKRRQGARSGADEYQDSQAGENGRFVPAGEPEQAI